nr:hypothetical protein OH826_15655 [Streptomyces sp. NBC_00899]
MDSRETHRRPLRTAHPDPLEPSALAGSERFRSLTLDADAPDTGSVFPAGASTVRAHSAASAGSITTRAWSPVICTPLLTTDATDRAPDAAASPAPVTA